jgi:uncharacterized protein YggU (UPF0235/DUF167 family)
VTAAPRAVRLAVKVVPGAARDEIAGWLGDALKLRVCAAPERGRANAAVEALLARALELPLANVRIVAGETSQRKLVEITGLAPVELRERLDAPIVAAERPRETRRSRP